VCLCPKLAGSAKRADAGLVPPGGFVTVLVNFAVMTTAKRDGELVADFAP
jgi:hypothetical protein